MFDIVFDSLNCGVVCSAFMRVSNLDQFLVCGVAKYFVGNECIYE